jgi:ATP-dependent DNA ligase
MTACVMGYEGIVSKRKGSHYRSGRSPDWLK